MTMEHSGRFSLDAEQYFKLYIEPLHKEFQGEIKRAQEHRERLEKAIDNIQNKMTTRSEIDELRQELKKLRLEIDERLDPLERRFQIAQWIFNVLLSILTAVVIAYATGLLG